MNKLTPDLYAEAFGILTRKLLKDDCLAMRANKEGAGIVGESIRGI